MKTAYENNLENLRKWAIDIENMTAEIGEMEAAVGRIQVNSRRTFKLL